MSCVSPPQPPLVVNESLPQRLRTVGSARVATPGWAGRASVLHLTATDRVYGQLTEAGSAVLYAEDLNDSPLPQAVAPWLRVTMLVRLRGNSSRSGLSISYGDVPYSKAGYGLGHWGVGGGLRVGLLLRRVSAASAPAVVGKFQLESSKV